MLRVQSVATSGAGPPVPRISVAAASSALLGKRIAGVQALPEAMLAGPPKRVRAQEPTTAAAVLRACKAVCALDPVVSGKDGRAAAAAGCGFTSELRHEVLRRWELTKLVAVLPDYALARAVNMSLVDFAAARPDRIAQYLFARAGAVTPAYIAQARSALLRLLRYNHDYGVPWDGAFGQLSEVDLFSFLLSVHSGALGKASVKQPGFDAVAGVWKGLHYLVQRLRLELPTDAVKTALPSAGSLRGRRALLQGAVPLPPEALASLFAYVCDPSKPRVLRSWAFALAFSTVSSLRQANAQNVSFYGELHVLGRDYLLSQHADPKSRGRVPTVFVTPLQDFSGSTAWFVQGRSLIWTQGDFLWADVQGDPRSHSAVLLRCPLEAGRIQWAMQIVLREACGMSATQAATITKHSARKTLVSAAQAAGCPWEQCIELGPWAGTALDSSFLLPQEDLRRKKVLECLSMPKRYSADARLRRVARIVGNQIQRLAAYLRAKPPVAAAQTFDTMWELMPQYNRFAEGS